VDEMAKIEGADNRDIWRSLVESAKYFNDL
jgi:hypothetical protein